MRQVEREQLIELGILTPTVIPGLPHHKRCPRSVNETSDDG